MEKSGKGLGVLWKWEEESSSSSGEIRQVGKGCQPFTERGKPVDKGRQKKKLSSREKSSFQW